MAGTDHGALLPLTCLPLHWALQSGCIWLRSKPIAAPTLCPPLLLIWMEHSLPSRILGNIIAEVKQQREFLAPSNGLLESLLPMNYATTLH